MFYINRHYTRQSSYSIVVLDAGQTLAVHPTAILPDSAIHAGMYISIGGWGKSRWQNSLAASYLIGNNGLGMSPPFAQFHTKILPAHFLALIVVKCSA